MRNEHARYLCYSVHGTNELYHHGVLGMKWGVRRYQPYGHGGYIPKDKQGSASGYHSSKVGPAGYSGSKEKTNRSVVLNDELRSKNKFRLSSIESTYEGRLNTKLVRQRTEKTVKDIADIQKWDDKAKNKILSGKRAVARLKVASMKLSRINEDTGAESNLPIKKKDKGSSYDARRVNPSYGDGTTSSGNNCALCTIAFDMRRRGYDVMAKQHAPINLLYDIGPEDVSWMYGYPKEQKTGSPRSLVKKLSSEPDGSRGAAFTRWSDSGGGHVVSYEVKDGKPVFYDAQTGDTYTNPYELFDNTSFDTSFIRLDDKKPKFNLIKLAVE